MENVNIDPSIKSAVASFVGFLELSAYKEIAINVLDVAIKNGVTKLILDKTHLQIIRPEIQAWLKDEWLQMVVNAGMQYLVYVLTKEEFANLSSSRLNEKYETIEIQYVDSLASAKAWMAKK